jgi:hypothetical protein
MTEKEESALLMIMEYLLRRSTSQLFQRSFHKAMKNGHLFRIID